jgi:hypothetical protein
MVATSEARMGLKVGHIRGLYRDPERDRFESTFVDAEHVVTSDGRDAGTREIYPRS